MSAIFPSVGKKGGKAETGGGRMVVNKNPEIIE